MTDLLDQLNDKQREAVLYCEGASLVIAGAGSGKTRVLTYKIAYLLQEKQLAPWNILALTFTNKAAREMKERIAHLVGDDRARYLQMGTFHSIFARILRSEAAAIGYQSNFTIYDQADSRTLVKTIIQEAGLEDKVYKPSSVADHISMAKNHLIMPDAFGSSSLFDAKHPQVGAIYKTYMARCRQANAMDFDDLLMQTYLLFEEHDDIRRKYTEKFLYVLVDEYQDTNYAQQQIVLQLTRERQQVCVVGDDAQSIYSFRGADIDNILNFREAYTNAQLFKLEQNYRSTQLIVQAANSLIRKNEWQIQKDVYSQNEHGEKLMLKPAMSDREEAAIVCNDIKRLHRKEGGTYGDFAILYRTNSQSRSFEDQMRKDGIPYRIYGGLSFYQRKEIKDVIAYFRTVVNPDDEEALRRIINYPARGIGDATLQKVAQAATLHGVSLFTIISQPTLFQLDVTRGTASKLTAFRLLIDGWHSRLQQEDAYQLGKAIIQESGIAKEIYASRNPEDLSRQQNIEEFCAGMRDFVDSSTEAGDPATLTAFLQEVALLTDLDSDKDSDEPKVSLMTIHSAKGLEFPTVFVVGLEENIFPSPLCIGSKRELEEERRLLYVAITRAERHCILTCAQNRFRFGRMEYDTPSRFIRDIDPRLLQTVSATEYSTPFPADATGRIFSPRTSQNPRPVATQFMADPKPRAVPTRREEPHVDPFSNDFKKLLHTASEGRFKPVAATRRQPTISPAATPSQGTLRVGMVIEHQRFGIGTVVHVEGNGDNEKATVSFRNTGTKQLLLKFARFKVVRP